MKIGLFFIVILSFFLFDAKGQGTVRGKISDANGETLIGVTIVFKHNKGLGTTTDFDGNYSLKVPDSGKVTLLISYLGYQPIEDEVHPVNGQVLIRNFTMKTSSTEMKEIEVTAKASREKDYYVEKIKKNSATTIDFISSETIKKIGDANVVNAVTRVSGVSSTHNDFITVRGMGDRYVKTAINGSIIPTLDPFTNNIKLDLIPSSLVDNVIIVKTASPDLPGDWSGAYLTIETKEYPETFSVNFETTFGYNTQSTYKEVISSQRSKTDWKGYDDGFRNHNHNEFNNLVVDPSRYQQLAALGLESYYNSLGINQYNWPVGTAIDDKYYKLGLIQLGLLSPALIDDANAFAKAKSDYDNGPYKSQAYNIINKNVPATGKSFPANWNTVTRKAPMNFSQSFSVGNQIALGRKKTLGYIAGFKYGSSYQYDEDATETRIRYDGNIESSITTRIGKETNGWSGLANLALKLNPNNSISFLFMPNQNGINRVKRSLDNSDYANYIWTNGQYYEERRQFIYQFKSQHYIPAYKAKLELNASYTDGRSNAPDFKYVQYYQNPITNVYQIGGTIGDGIHRYYRYLDDNILDTRISAELPFKSKPGLERKIKFGGGYMYNDKESDQYKYSLLFGPNSNFVLTSHDIDQLLSLNNFDIYSYTNTSGQTLSTVDAYYISAENPAYHTFGNTKVYSAFVMSDYSISTRLRVSGGLRVEHGQIFTDVVRFDSLNYAKDDIRRSYDSSLPLVNPANKEDWSYLPSINFIYKITPNEENPFNLRLGYFRSIARPSQRELSDVATFDFDRRKYVFGNSNLEMVTVNNYDVRTEKYFNNNDYVSVSGFYKEFKNHIEIIQSVGYTWENVDRSYVYGIELEGKKQLTKHFDAIANVTLATSNTEFTRQRMEINNGVRQYYDLDEVSRPMFGQAPYVVNAMLSYHNDSLGFSCAVSYNIQGPRLTLASDLAEIPDVYELPRNLLDFKVSKKLFKYFLVSFTIKDILNAPVRQTYKGNGWVTDYYNFSYGTIYSLGISFKL